MFLNAAATQELPGDFSGRPRNAPRQPFVETWFRPERLPWAREHRGNKELLALPSNNIHSRKSWVSIKEVSHCEFDVYLPLWGVEYQTSLYETRTAFGPLILGPSSAHRSRVPLSAYKKSKEWRCGLWGFSSRSCPQVCGIETTTTTRILEGS
jgi:hypothetical protein